ncbi:acyltransferase family protein [Sphingomonas sp. MA1305]|uniref:acyltransferase family protein n=1 Tax=Sphingomonas sp. MA1305 TaxID=2479204 RepID=UPI0018DF009C|nr:acyltransferase [Sphingomonas sp. MA1305]
MAAVLDEARPPQQRVVTGAGKGMSVSRIPGIDGLRALAILIVMVSHAGLGRFIPGGFGVTIFFFLSGYLITTLLRIEYGRNGRINLPAFYMRRVLRILPPLYLTLALVVALALIGIINVAVTPVNLALDTLFLTNYAGVLGLPSSTPIPLWSLDVEEHFYLLFPACFAALALWRGSRIARMLGAICLLTLLVRIATFAIIGEGEIYYWSHTRIDSIIFGAVLAVWQNPMLDEEAWRPRPMHVAAALLVIALTLAIRAPAFRETIRYTLQGAALFVLFSAAIQARGIVARLLDQRWLRIVALLSYTLYLVHMPMLVATRSLGLWSVPTAYLLAFAWAAAMYVFIERPLARRRQRSLRKAVQGI